MNPKASNPGVGHIVAMGGGGFSMEPDNPLLDDFVLSLSRRHPARVCFIPTASADSATYIVSFYRAFSGRCVPTDLTLFDSPLLTRRPARSSELATFVAEQDLIYVGGGSTANLLALWRVHGLDVVLREAWSNGMVLSGVSAGMVCWFSGGLADSYGGLERLSDGLALIEATACPHYSGMKSGDEPIIGQSLRGSGQATPLTTALLFTSLGRRSLTWSALDPTQVPIELSVSKDASSKPDYRFASWAQRIRRPATPNTRCTSRPRATMSGRW